MRGGVARRLWLESLPPGERRTLLEAMSERQLRAFDRHWLLWAHAGQLPPPGEWFGWLVMAGRGFGKTRAGAEWVRAVAESDPAARIALVGASLDEARAVMVEGDSGLLAIASPRRRPAYEPSRRLLRWPNGAQARLYSAAEPESLRGPQHSHAWCDEIGKWNLAADRAVRAWDNLVLGLRLGRLPQVAATTTPRAVPLVQRLLADADFTVTRGATGENARNLPPTFIAAVERRFAGSQFGRQELGGELLTEIEGALWRRALLERVRAAAVDEVEFVRVVVGVDPPAGTRGDACGIVVAAELPGGHAAVLADCSVAGASPEGWARAVAEAAHAWHADRVVAEANQGGAMVASVLRAADVALPVKLVHATRGKAARAEPVAALYEAGRVRHAGMFAKLEDEMCGLLAGGRYEGPGRSPDRADALVWALTELLLGRRVRPRISVI
ncbi:DNA-packaging protein [Pelagerythrobacter sp.]|uniref:DNA-packaging protein n=1 Tax=Pelagerythrobacter sp. TaxID=2800702 RepID=UPI0035AFE261